MHISSSRTRIFLGANQSDDNSNSIGGTLPSRRVFISKVAITSGAFALITASAPSAFATLMDSTVDGAQVFKAGKPIGIEEAKNRFKLARRDLKTLLENYDEIKQGGGDAVRRYLGTVGVSSYMYGISKVLKELRDEADDLVEFSEKADEFNAYVMQSDGAAYQSLFVEHSSAKGTPESFLKIAKKDAETAMRLMDELAGMLNM